MSDDRALDSEPSMMEQAEDIARDIEKLMRENEFWYLALKSAVAMVVRTAGTDGAEAMLERVREEAIAGYPPNMPEALVSEPAASFLLEGLRRLALLWSEHGSIAAAYRAVGSPEVSDG